MCGGGGGGGRRGKKVSLSSACVPVSFSLIFPVSSPNSSVQFSSVEDGLVWAQEKTHNYALHPVSQKFPQLCL